MHGLKEENVAVDRKILAELARTEPYSFKALVDQVKRMKGIA
jgi:large subunit ribosomal protein L20